MHQGHHPATGQSAERADREGLGGGRPPAFDKHKYRDRNTVERAINLLRGYRAVATRYDCEFVYKGTFNVASINIWLRDLSARAHGTRPRLRISVDLGRTVVTATWSDEATPWIS